ncbi:MAG: RNA methyltransferase [Aerococcus sp.]|nr:RNA methyltransferase [Aerococcus sp.]
MISSRQNKQIKAIKKLQTKRGREKSGYYMIEGHHLVEEALTSGAFLDQIYATEEQSTFYPSDLTTVISHDVAQFLTETEHSQDVFAVIHLTKTPLHVDQLSRAVLLLDGIQDPGNLGTLVRTADAFGYGDILLGNGTVDLYNDKVLRSMQGSHFHVGVHAVDLLTAIPQLQRVGYQVAATLLDESAADLRAYNLRVKGKWAIVLGNEGNGVSKAVADLCDVKLFIPMTGDAESLNVAIAGAIAMYQFPPTDKDINETEMEKG